jgi:hypothetical protein
VNVERQHSGHQGNKKEGRCPSERQGHGGHVLWSGIDHQADDASAVEGEGETESPLEERESALQETSYATDQRGQKRNKVPYFA